MPLPAAQPRPTLRILLMTLAVIAGLWIVAAPSSAQAQSSQAEQAAKIHYKRSQKLYKQEKFDEAADELRKAYALAPFPLFLYNISLAEWRAGRLEIALQTALRARDEGVPKPLRPKLEARIAALGSTLKARRIAEGLRPEPQEPVAVVEPPTEAPEPGFGAMGWAGAGLTLAGAGMLTGALIIDQQLAADDDAFEAAAASGNGDEYDRQLADLEQRQMIGRVLGLSGLALAATGATLIVIELTDDDAETSGPAARLHTNPRADGVEMGLTVDF